MDEQKQVPATSNDQTIEHKVTSEDLENNPDLKEEGVNEGEVIGILKQETEETPAEGEADSDED